MQITLKISKYKANIGYNWRMRYNLSCEKLYTEKGLREIRRPFNNIILR